VGETRLRRWGIGERSPIASIHERTARDPTQLDVEPTWVGARLSVVVPCPLHRGVGPQAQGAVCGVASVDSAPTETWAPLVAVPARLHNGVGLVVVQLPSWPKEL
jgi:hypothetical protein